MGKPNYTVVLTPSADQDLAEIFQYVASQLNAPDTAAQLVAKLHQTLAGLVFLPQRHALVKDNFLSKQGFRVLPKANYLIFYVSDKNTRQVIIHRILSAKRNYLKLFQQN
ncbi:MAG: type II toxin-antitoxin system RelE/ParE family toxin [Candidatus Margulisbacteria bacterium]|jgi:addiction module RelE/StbE family toxin|nr:type II toxin-antitoxin system RelE/ParE family toxin [Candidatus Margulisiibacteriota bacterium]